MYNPRKKNSFYSFSARVSFDFETQIMSTSMSTSRSNYTDMSIWKKHADHSTKHYTGEYGSTAYPATNFDTLYYSYYCWHIRDFLVQLSNLKNDIIVTKINK